MIVFSMVSGLGPQLEELVKCSVNPVRTKNINIYIKTLYCSGQWIPVQATQSRYRMEYGRSLERSSEVMFPMQC